MELVRMQVTCLFFIVFIGILFFTSKKPGSYIYKLFCIMLASATLYLIFDIITVYTVNHLDTVPAWVNRLCHQIFIGSLDVTLFLISVYIVDLIGSNLLSKKSVRILWIIPVAASLVVVAFGDLQYKSTSSGNYSYGIMANTCYTSIGIYLILSLALLVRFWKQVDRRKRYVIFAALAVETILSILQGIHPTWLISSLGITMIMISIFLTMETLDRGVGENEHRKHKGEEGDKEPDFDQEYAIENIGNEELYQELLHDFYVDIPERIDLIKKYENNKDVKNFTITVHGLKSTARLLGANKLGTEAEKLEKMGYEGEWAVISLQTKVFYEYFDDLYGRMKTMM